MEIKKVFTCADPECSTLTRFIMKSDTLDESFKDNIDDYVEVYCPICGRKNSLKREIPEFMINAVDILRAKGYHVLNVFPKILGLQVAELSSAVIESIEQDAIQSICNAEFIIDVEDDTMRLIKNGRLQDANGFDDYEVSKEEYILNAIKELEAFLLKLPEVGTAIERVDVISTVYF